MTTAQKKRVGELIVNALIGLVSTLFVLFGTGAWGQKENVVDHNADVAALVELQVRTLDLLCDVPANAQKRACQADRPTLKVRP